MARQARGKSIDPTKIQVSHTFQRCVRQAFLCGDDLESVNSSASTLHERPSTHAWARSGQGGKSGWMSPVEIDEAHDPVGADLSLSPVSGELARRSSLKGFLILSFEFYMELINWTGRNLVSRKRGSISADLDSIFKRLGIVLLGWCDMIEQFGRLFKRAVGSLADLAE